MLTLSTLIRSLMARLRQEDGAESVEFLGLIVVIVVLMLAVAGFISSGDSQIGQAVLDVFESWIRSLGG